MDFSQIEVLYPIVLAPLITSVIGYIFSRIGGKDRMQSLEYDLKQAELLRTMIANDSIRADKEPMLRRLDQIAVRHSYDVNEKLLMSDLPYHQRPWFQKVFLLPQPRSAGGRVLTFAYYMYAIYGFIQLPWIPQIINEASQRSLLAAFGIIGSFILAAICHTLAVRQVTRDRLIDWAREELMMRRQDAVFQSEDDR